MENQKLLSNKKTVNTRQNVNKLSKRELMPEAIRALGYCVFALLLGTRQMIFESYPLAFSLLSASTRYTLFLLIGVILSSFAGAEFSLNILLGACLLVALRMLSRLFLDSKQLTSKKEQNESTLLDRFSVLFSENVYLRMMSGALAVFFIGIWRIIEGGFRFYDLFAAIFYLILTPVGTLCFVKFFNVSEQKRVLGSAFSQTPQSERLYYASLTLLGCSFIFSLGDANLLGISLPIFIGLIFTLYATKSGILYGTVAGLLFGISISPTYAPMLALCALAYSSVVKLSLFGASLASCIAGLVWGIYVEGIGTLASSFPALLSASMLFCTAERINVFEDLSRFFQKTEASASALTVESVIAEQKVNLQGEKLKSISDSFASLSEIFYNLSSRLKRPTMLDLRAICEDNFEKQCKKCENREHCYGVEYASTLDVMKKMTVKLHSSGYIDEKKLPETFKKRCNKTQLIVDNVNKSCSIATKKAFQNEKIEIFALDYDAISKILNDAIAENDEEFKLDGAMSKKLSRVIAEEGYGEHNVMVFGKRKLKILARGLDLSDKNSDVNMLRSKLEGACRVCLTEPTFELSFGSVNMQIEAKRTFSADAAFATHTSEGENVCGDSVSIFENKNDYLYCLISDGMGTGKNAAVTSETCSAFLQNMLNAGNKMETSLRMLNSVLRVRGARSEDECSATIDLLQFDLYSGALTVVKSGAAPTFVLRRGNVFKLASPSFPIGILRALDAKQIDISCEDGDIIVMVSDGATFGLDDCAYLCDMLREESIPNKSPSEIAEQIIRRARAEKSYNNDDVSVAVIKIKKEICNW